MGFAGRNKNGLYELQCISEVRPRASPLRRERDEALRERDAARKQLAARNDMLAQVLKEQQY